MNFAYTKAIEGPKKADSEYGNQSHGSFFEENIKKKIDNFLENEAGMSFEESLDKAFELVKEASKSPIDFRKSHANKL